MAEYYIGLGSNMGDRAEMLCKAVQVLRNCHGITVNAMSSVYETPPWGKIEQSAFLNAVIKIGSDWDPEDILQQCLAAEKVLGRIRREKWGARTIDIDLLYSPTVHLNRPLLTLPHPYLTERAFALVPLKEIAPGLVIRGRSIDDWLKYISGVEHIHCVGHIKV